MKKVICLISILFLFSLISFGQKETNVNQTQKVTSDNFLIENVLSFSNGEKVWLSWQTKNESKILGYNIYRSNGNLKRRQVNASILAGSVMSSNGRIEEKDYSFIDSDGDLSSFYYVESIDINGNKTEFAPIFPQFSNDLSNLIGVDLNQNYSVTNDKVIAPRDAIDGPQRLGLTTAEETQRWVAAQPGVKITVNKEGIHRVTKSALQAAGFNLTANESLWQLYADGIEQAILVNANDIEFYGKGIDTITADKRVYYLLVGTTPGKRITSSIRRQIRGTLIGKNFESSIEYKDKLSYASGILNGESDNFFGKAIIGAASNPTPTTMTINVPNPDSTVDKNDIEIAIQPLTVGNHSIQVFFNNELIGTMNGVDKVTMFSSFGVGGSLMIPGTNTLKFVAQNGSNDISLIMSAKLIYKRKYESFENRLNFYTQHYQHTKVSGFSTSNIRVFDISDFTTPKLISNPGIVQNGATFAVNLLSNRTRSMYAVEESGIQTPVSVTQNVPSTLSGATRNADLIIISHGNFMAQAETWATYRRSQGLNVEVVNIDDIFDEFNFGYTQPDGIKAFFQYVYTNWTNVKYSLIIGDATYDYRGYNSSNPFANYIPTKLVDTVYLETGSDETLADFNDDGLAEISIGRIPIRDTTSLTTVFNKITSFESGVLNALVNRGGLFVSDEPNGYDFVGINTRIAAELPANVPKFFTYKPDLNSRAETLALLNQGRFIVNWSGHGNTAVWSANTFINKADMAALTNTNFTIFTLLTCLNGYYIDPLAGDVFGEVALKNPNGGASAVWASSGLTTADVQEVMAKRFYYLLGNDPNMIRIGDLIKDSKTTIPFGRDVRLSWALLGDPTMKVK